MAELLTPNGSAGTGLQVLNDMLASAGDARDLSQQQIPFLRSLFEDRDVGLFLFAQHIFGYKDLTATLHLPMTRLLGRWGESVLDDGTSIFEPPAGDLSSRVVDSYRRFMFIIPREHFKSSVARSAVLWTIARDPSHDPTIGYFNEVADNVEKWISAICEVVESNRLFQVLWREMLPPGISYWDKEAGRTMPRRWKWGGTGVLFNRNSVGTPELSIEPHGIGGSATGKHFTHMVLDDIIGEKASQSPAIMQDAINWVDNQRPLERPAEHGCEAVFCTPWAYNDPYCWAPESRVWMADGSWKAISDVQVGDSVVGFRKVNKPTKAHLVRRRGGAQSTTELCVTKVVNCGSKPSAVVTHLLSDGQSFRCTEDHKFFKVWKSGRTGSDYYKNKGLTDYDYAQVKDLTRLRKVMNPFGASPDAHVAGWLGGMYDADGSYHKNTIVIYQSEKHHPEVCQRIRDSFDILGIAFQEYETAQETKLGFSRMKQFVVSDRENRAKFIAWCKPSKHLEKLNHSLVSRRAFSVVRIVGRSSPDLCEVHWIETDTGNYICEGLASKNSHKLKKWSGEYKVYRRSILEDREGRPDAVGGESIFPQKISTTKARKLLSVDSYTNYAQYMCLPKAGRQQDFSEEWLHYGKIVYAGNEPCFLIDPNHYDPNRRDIDTDEPAPQLVPLNWMDKAVLLDPAPSKRSELKSDPHARNAIVVVGIDPWRRRFAFDCAALRDGPLEVMHELMRLYQQWQADRIGIEEVNFSAVYAPFMLNIIRRDYSLSPTFVPLETKGRQKAVRISNNLKTPHEDGFWYYNRDACGLLIQELLEYPNSMTCDLVDALAYTDEAVFPQATPTSQSRNHYQRRRQAASLGVTGYGDFV